MPVLVPGAAILAAFSCLVVANAGPARLASWWPVAVLCLAGATLFGRYVLTRLRDEPQALFFDGSIYLAFAASVYFCGGPLIYVLASEEVRAYTMAERPVDPHTAFSITAMNLLGAMLTLRLFNALQWRPIAEAARSASHELARVPASRLLAAVAIAGFSAKFLSVVPYEVLLTSRPPSAPERELARLPAVVVMVLWSLVTARRPGALPLALLAAGVEIVTAGLMFNKTDLLATVIAATLGAFMGCRRLGVLVIGGLIGVTLFSFTSPYVTFGRDRLTHLNNGEGQAPATLSERARILQDYSRFASDGSYRVPGETWQRLNYLPDQAHAMRFYDRGNGGRDAELVKWLVVPRLLVPSKPVMSTAGIDLHEKIDGHRLSSTGIGVFVDGYYNAGWVGFCAAILIVGFALRLVSEIAWGVLEGESLLMYPLMFVAVMMGLRIDGWLLVDYVGQAIVAAGLLVGFLGIASVLRPRLAHA
jgi:hypothetical protein